MIKRCFDFIVSLALLILLSPLFIGIAICIKVFMPGPVLFRQCRPGLHSEIFTMIKFRTMVVETENLSGELSDDQRLTRLGKFLRLTSLDELPELFNVLIGDMSLVGPRPLLVDYLPLYTPEQSRRHSVRPGITGWAQVNGRNAISWNEKFTLDVWYVDNLSFSLDLKILAMTIIRVLKRDGISEAGQATASKFKGG